MNAQNYTQKSLDAVRTAQSMAFKRIAAGLIACMAPTIISMISY